MATSAGMVVAMPLISNSSSARSIRAMAVSRSAPQQISLPTQVVVELADLVAGLVAAVPADAEALGHPQRGDRPGRGQERAAGRVLGVDAHLDGVAPTHDVVLRERQRLARGHPDLLGDEVEPGDQLGDRVLDLQPGVHLQEVELAVLVEELDGAGVDVAARLGDLDRGLAHGLADLVGEAGRRALLDQLLVAALRRAVALADPHGVAVGVGEHLHLDVAGPGQVALDVALAAAEALERLGLRRLERVGGLGGRPHHPHAPAAAAVGGLDGDRPAVLLAEGHHLVGRREELGGAGHARPPRPAGRRCRDDTLSPMTSMASGGGPMKVTPWAVMARAKSVFSLKNP